ncbi:MAG: hypothetical protein JW861_08365 [Bacteroidales bacterium]|nr:hypothetical protein [Bacteroidales bacterium]
MSPKKKSGQISEPLEQYRKPLTFETVWQLFCETDRKFQETDRQFKETDRRFKETDRQFKETDMQFKETDRKLRELHGLFTSQWGKMIESLVEGDLIRLLNERGISVMQTSERITGNYRGTSYEFDILAENGSEVVIVEVKTTLKPADVKEFIYKLSQARTWMSKLKDQTVYGAIAYLRADAGSKKMAENQGLFVIRAAGNSASIVNAPEFRPKVF